MALFASLRGSAGYCLVLVTTCRCSQTKLPTEFKPLFPCLPLTRKSNSTHERSSRVKASREFRHPGPLAGTNLLVKRGEANPVPLHKPPQHLTFLLLSYRDCIMGNYSDPTMRKLWGNFFVLRRCSGGRRQPFWGCPRHFAHASRGRCIV
ncbi:hypothetical protein LX36DRAFT_316612 [Colletotrichum falcatum]|nr:hypothetical protein LX36DRAFT_316612 [Colletotrichum falcatum]